VLKAAKASGFTIVELMIGLAIVAILVFNAIPSYTAWIQNTKIRNAAESVSNGLQLARAEAIRRNASVQFELGADSGWTVRVPDPAEIVQQRSAAQGSNGVTRATQPGAATMVTFNSLGRVAPNANGSASITQVTFDVPTTMLPAALSRDLQVTVSPAGRVRMCDPNVTDPNDIRNCA
jgi:type IV fimbrial biogenesis protein FimT